MSLASSDKVLTLHAPMLLVATPQLRDARFLKTVILLCEHSDEATMGLVLNRPSETSVLAFLRSLSMKPEQQVGGNVFQGGPVQQDRAFVLHQSPHRGPETQVIEGEMCLSFSLESLKMMVADIPEKWRIYTGYAGWGKDQLAREIAEGSWLLAPARALAMFEETPEKLYDEALSLLAIDPARLRSGSGMN